MSGLSETYFRGDGILEDSGIIPNLVKLLGIASDPTVLINRTGRSVGSHGGCSSLWLQSVLLISKPGEVQLSLFSKKLFMQLSKSSRQKAELVQTKVLLYYYSPWMELLQIAEGSRELELDRPKVACWK